MKILQKIYPLSLKTKNTLQKEEKKHEGYIVNEVLEQKRTLGNLKYKVWTLVCNPSAWVLWFQMRGILLKTVSDPKSTGGGLEKSLCA